MSESEQGMDAAPQATPFDPDGCPAYNAPGTKADLTKLAIEVGKTNALMETMEDRLASLIREESARNTARIDAFLGRLETYGRETVLIPNALDAHGKTLSDHERRLARLETA